MFVAIFKRVADLDDKSGYAGLPDTYPVECCELNSASEIDAFLIKYPSAEVMPLEQYKGMEKGLSLLYDHAKAQLVPKPGIFARIFGAK